MNKAAFNKAFKVTLAGKETRLEKVKLWDAYSKQQHEAGVISWDQYFNWTNPFSK